MWQIIKAKAIFGEGTLMKRSKYVSVGVFLLLLGSAAPIYAKPQEKDKQPPQGQEKQPQQRAQQPPQQQQRQPQQRAQQPPQQQQRQPQQRAEQPPQQQQRQPQQRAQQPPQQQQRQPQQRAQQQQQGFNRPSGQEQRVARAQQPAVWQQHRASNWQADHRTWQQRGGYSGYRIPDDRFRPYFGSGHRFRIYNYPMVVVGGYPRFQYGGFWFSVVDPWPEYWSDDWYDSDDVYIDYTDGGYYLYDQRYPGVGLAVEVALN